MPPRSGFGGELRRQLGDTLSSGAAALDALFEGHLLERRRGSAETLGQELSACIATAAKLVAIDVAGPTARCGRRQIRHPQRR